MTLLGGWLEFRRLRKRIREAPQSRLGALSDREYARVSGRAQALGASALEAPLSARRCVYYEVTIMAFDHGETESWRLASECVAEPFVLADADDRAVIDTARARFACAVDYRAQSSPRKPAPHQRRLLERHRLFKLDPRRISHLIYREAIIALDEPITILGAAMREPDPAAVSSGSYRDAATTRWRFSGTEHAPLLISDDPDSLTGLATAMLQADISAR